MNSYYDEKLLNNKKSFSEDIEDEENIFLKKSSLIAFASGGMHKNKTPMAYLNDCFSSVFNYHGVNHQSKGDKSEFISQFQKSTFNNGTLASAIMNGEGRLFLTAALKQSAYLTENIANQKQKKLLNTSKIYQIRNGREKIVINQKEARSAVGMVVDATKSATEIIKGIGLSGKKAESLNISTLKGVFPFLFDDEKVALDYLVEQKYNMEKENKTDSSKYRLVVKQISQIKAIIAKKSSLKKQFMLYVDNLLVNAKKAIDEFEDSGLIYDMESDADIEIQDESDEPDEQNNEEDFEEIREAEETKRD